MVILLHAPSTMVFAIGDGKAPNLPTDRVALTSCSSLREARGY